MLLKYFYDSALAHASYLVGCQQAREAVVIDPGRDIDAYLDVATGHGLEIVGAVETHIHADYVSGARELADRVSARLYVSDAGPDEWKYTYVDDYPHQRLKDGDQFQVGKIEFDVLFTPGHTPESLSFVLTDRGGGAQEPMGIFSGDFVFVGSIGRPDLLEEAAGMADTAEPGARDLFQSVKKFFDLPDFLQVWPAHGAGSACGKGLGAIPSSTVGYEKRFNPALQFDDEEAFVKYILAGQPPAPKYFAVMKRVNKEGPRLLSDLTPPSSLHADQLNEAKATGMLLDTASPGEFSLRHVPGSVNIALPQIASWAGWIVDYERPLYLITEAENQTEVIRLLRKIGVDQIQGVFYRNVLEQSNALTEQYANASPQELAPKIAGEEVHLVDVRSDDEWDSGHIPQAKHHFLGRLSETMSDIPNAKPIVVHCQSGVRSAIASSILRATGRNVTNMLGGYAAWGKADLPTTGKA